MSIVWEQRCEFIKSLDELNVRDYRSITDNRRSRNLKVWRFGAWTICACAGYSSGLRRWTINAAFGSRILSSTVINSKHIEPRQYFEDARKIVLDRVRDVLQKHDALKINIVFNGESVAGNKSANKSIAMRNYVVAFSSIYIFVILLKL